MMMIRDDIDVQVELDPNLNTRTLSNGWKVNEVRDHLMEKWSHWMFY